MSYERKNKTDWTIRGLDHCVELWLPTHMKTENWHVYGAIIEMSTALIAIKPE